jgi:hypothetical protein
MAYCSRKNPCFQLKTTKINFAVPDEQNKLPMAGIFLADPPVNDTTVWSMVLPGLVFRMLFYTM